MALHRSRIFLRVALAVAALALSISALEAQDKNDKSVALRIPYTTVPVTTDCSNTRAIWENVPRVALSKHAVADLPADAKMSPVLDANRPIAAIVLMSNPSKPATSLPSTVESKLDSFHEQYAFQWDEKRLYGYVEIKEQHVDSGHPKIPEETFRRSPAEAASANMFFSSMIVEVGAASWQRWTTEMHIHVRSPKARPMKSMFFGRTTAEEDFHELSGEAIACPIEDGWIAKFAVDWLPYVGNLDHADDWIPKPGVTAEIRLIVPLAHAHEGYVLASVVPFVLTK